MTTPTRWQEIDRIFAAALDCEPAARAAFLAEACGGDEQLRAQVESLLASDVPESLVLQYHFAPSALEFTTGTTWADGPGCYISRPWR